MTKCNSRHSPTTKVPLEERTRTPHRSGQEYEYGETPETGLADAGVGADPDRQCARVPAQSARRPEDEDEGEIAQSERRKGRPDEAHDDDGSYGHRRERGESRSRA
jgi:hypothetical protein